jgi:hypothetical protein
MDKKKGSFHIPAGASEPRGSNGLSEQMQLIRQSEEAL